MSFRKKRVCEPCGKQFACRQSLFAHRKKHHKEMMINEDVVVESASPIPTPTKNHPSASFHGDFRKPLVKCGVCGLQLLTHALLCSHMSTEHDIQAEVKHHKFPTRQAYLQWMMEAERQGRFKFISQGGRRTRKDMTTIEYLYCHRSGTYNSKSTGARSAKKGVTIKVNYHCTAYAKVVTSLTTDETDVVCCLDHYGHDDALQRLKMPRESRVRIARMIADNKDMEYILHAVRNDYDVDELGQIRLNRSNLVTRKDLHNIRKQFGLTPLSWPRRQIRRNRMSSPSLSEGDYPRPAKKKRFQHSAGASGDDNIDDEEVENFMYIVDRQGLESSVAHNVTVETGDDLDRSTSSAPAANSHPENREQDEEEEEGEGDPHGDEPQFPEDDEHVETVTTDNDPEATPDDMQKTAARLCEHIMNHGFNSQDTAKRVLQRLQEIVAFMIEHETQEEPVQWINSPAGGRNNDIPLA